MNQRHLWTIVALFITILGTPLVGRTQTPKETTLASQKVTVPDVVKVGEYQPAARKQTSDAVITEIHSHNMGGRQAATLFIRKIPVLTFLSSSPVTSVQTKVGAIGNQEGVKSYALINANSRKISRKVGDVVNVMDVSNWISSVDNDPVHRAGLVAARINQLLQENVDASQITVSWKAGSKSPTANLAENRGDIPQQLGNSYAIKVNGKELVEINENTRLADTTKDLAQDALQITNRLRRLIGNASPLSKIANLPLSIPKLPRQFAIRGMRINFKGIASWYGYDGSGTQTASGERFNPEGLTAAHRTLPLGTRVRVTNTYNGRSVVVRINDRGPYIGGRIIDLSAAAARILGMMHSGVAPVKIEILGR